MLKSKIIALEKTNNAYKIKLDNSFLKSPAGKDVIVQNKAIGEELIKDIYFLREHKTLKDYSPLKLVFSLLDKTEQIDKNLEIQKICKYFTSDCVLYWSKDSEILKLQQEKLTPIIELLNTKLNAKLSKTFNLFLVENIDTKGLLNYLNNLSKEQIYLFASLAFFLESVGVTYLIFNNLISKENAFNVAFLHDIYNQERWGKDKLKAKELERKKQVIDNFLMFITSY